MKPKLFLTFCFLFSLPAIADTKLLLGNFSLNQLKDWQIKDFRGETRYRLRTENDKAVLLADSQDSGSGLFKEQRVDLDKTPFLNWSWRINNKMSGLNEQSKAGDDYAARIYVLIKGGLAFWQTKAINYVWTGNTAKDTVWPNAFAGDHAMMLAQRGPEAAINTWYHEKRNVKDDFKRIMAIDIRYLDAVAIMTDTDNSHGQVSATYGDIWFSQE